MKKIGVALFFILCIALGVIFGEALSRGHTIHKKETLGNPATTQPSVVISPTPAAPLRLSIPAINIDTAIESVGLDSQGRMDVPSKEEDVAWFDLGFRPGQLGNAVVDGHLDQVTGAPAVFWNLKKLVPGDTITVTDAANKTYTFVVSKAIAYDYNHLPMQQIFGPSSSAHLNLITCNGTWDKENKNYSQRFVVYADLKK